MAARFLPAAERLARFGMNVSGMTSRWVDVDGMRVHVYDGEGRGDLPTTVMIHGLGSAGIAFASVVARLRPHVKRVIVPELPGHGLSTHPGDRQVTPELVLDTISAALDKVVTEPVVVVGNSLGGAVAIDYAKRHPEQVRALVLVSPAGARLADEEWKKLVSAFATSSRPRRKSTRHTRTISPRSACPFCSSGVAPSVCFRPRRSPTSASTCRRPR